MEAVAYNYAKDEGFSLMSRYVYSIVKNCMPIVQQLSTARKTTAHFAEILILHCLDRIDIFHVINYASVIHC